MSHRKIKISALQLFLLIIALIFSDIPIVNNTRFAMQDAWLAYLIGMLMGIGIITIYIGIARMHMGKNLVEILQDTFGKTIGTVAALLYLWYFLHIAAIVLRVYSEYMVVVNYFETPKLFIMICLMIIIVYNLRKGFEVVGRVSELSIPLMAFSVIVLFFLLASSFKFDFIRPFLKEGLAPVLRVAWGIATYPFGELIILLMIFPYLNEQNKLARTTYLGVAAGGILLFLIIIRDLLVLGPNLLSILVFPANVSTALLPTVGLEPLISINLLIGGLGFLCVYIHSATLAIAQIFKIQEHRIFILPIVSLIIGLSIWLYDNISEMFAFLHRVYAYYSILFQIVIPLIILLVSYIKAGRRSQLPTQ